MYRRSTSGTNEKTDSSGIADQFHDLPAGRLGQCRPRFDDTGKAGIGDLRYKLRYKRIALIAANIVPLKAFATPLFRRVIRLFPQIDSKIRQIEEIMIVVLCNSLFFGPRRGCLACGQRRDERGQVGG
jgi:hypothetical protein